MTVTVYSTPTCPWCKKVKAFLKAKKVAFKSIDVSSNQKAADTMMKKTGQMGVPVTDINGTIIIGYNEAAIEQALKKKKK